MSACSFLNYMAGRSANAADEALAVAEWGLCKGASVGAIRRNYANDPIKLRAWQDFCGKERTPAIFIPSYIKVPLDENRN